MFCGMLMNLRYASLGHICTNYERILVWIWKHTEPKQQFVRLKLPKCPKCPRKRTLVILLTSVNRK